MISTAKILQGLCNISNYMVNILANQEASSCELQQDLAPGLSQDAGYHWSNRSSKE